MIDMATNTRLTGALLLVIWCCSVASGAMIDVGYHALLPNTDGQQITIMVTGGENVAGIDFFAQVGDGGPELINVGLPPGIDAPTIVSADLLTDTIFSGTPATQFDHDRAGVLQVLASGAALSDPPPAIQSVPASGLLVTLNINTTGFYAGTFDLILLGVLPLLDGGPFDTTLVGSNGVPVATQIINGTVAVTVTRNGDYNHDGIVDAADYTVWRNALGQTGPGLAADGDGNLSINENDYFVWKSAYGMVTGPPGTGGSAFHLAVPEPATLATCFLAFFLWPLGRRAGSENRLF
jgi:hypothetical protein